MNTSYPKEKLKILLLENIHPSAIKLLRDSGYTDIESISGSLSEKELSDKISKVHVVGIRSKTQLTETVLKNAERLIAVGAFCIGINQIKMDEARKQGIAVFNSTFSNTRSSHGSIPYFPKSRALRRYASPNDRAQGTSIFLFRAE